MTKRKVRDIYGNWVWEDTDTPSRKPSSTSPNDEQKVNGDMSKGAQNSEDPIKLEWRDYLALVFASLETYMLPLVIFIILLFVLAIVLNHLI